MAKKSGLNLRKVQICEKNNIPTKLGSATSGSEVQTQHMVGSNTSFLCGDILDQNIKVVLGLSPKQWIPLTHSYNLGLQKVKKTGTENFMDKLFA